MSLFLSDQSDIFVSYLKLNDLKRASMSQLKEGNPIHKLLLSMSKFGMTILAVLLSFSLNAQGWEKSFGGGKTEEGRAVLQTIDLGYIAVGLAESFGADNDQDIYVVRTDIDGTLIWSKIYDEGIKEQANAIIQTEDKGFLIVGDIVDEAGASEKVYLLKISKKGKFEWSRKYPSNARENGKDIVKAPDGGYAIIGTTKDTDNGEDDILLIKVDENGNELWRKHYGGEKDDRGSAIVNYGGGFAFIGSSKIAVDNNIVLYKIDASGNEVLWMQNIGTSQNEEGRDLVATQDGNLAITGLMNNNSDAFIAKYASDGGQMWSKSIDINGFGEEGNAIIELQDGSLVITGIAEIDAANIDILIAKVSSTGDFIWAETLGEIENTDFGEDIAGTRNGGFVITGFNSLMLSFFNDLSLIKTDGGGNTITNFITGKVFYDEDEQCDYDEGEMPFEGWLVKAKSGETTFFGTTNADGAYEILVDTGSYEVSLLPANNYWRVCEADGYQTDFSVFYDTTSLNFSVSPEIICPFMEVDISTPFLTICSDVVYTVSYCNLGTEGASGASVDVELDEELEYLSSSIPVAAQQGNVYTFEIGDFDPTDCGSFTINTTMACEGIASGQAGLVSAHIFPDTLCTELDPNWDGASVIVSGECENDSLKFFIRNAGQGDMLQQKTYFIVEDDVMFLTEPFQLDADEDAFVSFPGTGSTYRLIAEQSDFHPGSSNPTVAVEGCVEDGMQYLTGQVTQFPENDRDPFISIDVQEAIGSVQENEMRGYPKGYRDSIIAANTDITYNILFSNVGTDTINRVVIRDTLSPYLDVSRVIPGTSSHPYNLEVYDNGILKITFSAIELLPGSSAGELNASGFVKFRIAQKPDNAEGTEIENSAAVFFENEEPGQTNMVRHVVGTFPDFVVFVVNPTFAPGIEIKVYPNPFMESVTIEIVGRVYDSVNLSVYDLMGRLVRLERNTGNKFEFYRHQLPSGIYFYKLESEGQLINSGKILVR